MIVQQSPRGPIAESGDPFATLDALRPLVEAHITRERVLHYLTALADAPAPSTAASTIRAPLLRGLLSSDGALGTSRLTLDANFANTGSTVMLTGENGPEKRLWYFAHLDTISYLLRSREGQRYPLVPFCYHLIGDGIRDAVAFRYDMDANRYLICAQGSLVSEAGTPYFLPVDGAEELRPGDRVSPRSALRVAADGIVTGHLDNAGGAAALAVAAPVLAEAGIDAMLAFPDEEEGPPGSGSQVMGRGGSRIVARLPSPDLAIVADMQQAGGQQSSTGEDGPSNTTRLGRGAVLSEFSSLARGAVTPPDLYVLARQWSDRLAMLGLSVQESNNAYTSRSDDVSVLLKTPNILLLGFPGFNRHFDRSEPSANLSDIVGLSKALVYVSVLRSALVDLRRRQDFG
ncbi:hypothetical protein [Mesorhizobium sp. 10J20-29]